MITETRAQLRRELGTVPRRHRTLRRVPWALVVPAVVLGIGIVVIAPMFGAWYAFTDWNGYGAARWIGVANFSRIFADDETRTSIFTTLKLAGSFFVLVNLLGLALALAVNRVLKTRHLLRSVFFLPVVVIPLATSYIWQFILAFNGPLNGGLAAVGLHSLVQPWLADPSLALWAVLVVMLWQYTGLTMILYLAGLQGIPPELDEAASVDGASSWVRFRRITVPLLTPALAVSSTLTLIIGLRAFDQILALTSGGPGFATQTLATETYQQTFVNGHFGLGAALALLLSAIVLVLIGVMRVVTHRREG